MRRLLPLFLLTLPLRISSPPLANPADPTETRSAFAWLTEPAFPQCLSVSYRVTGHAHTTPARWESVWVVVGTEQHFLSFTGHPGGWFISSVIAGGMTLTLASGEFPTFPDGEEHQVSLRFDTQGFGVAVENADTRAALGDTAWGFCATWQGEEGNPDKLNCVRPAPVWLGEPVRAGVYLEDCQAEVTVPERPAFTPDWEVLKQPVPLPKPKKGGGGCGL